MINKFNINILSLAAIALFTFSCTQTKEIKPTVIEEETTTATSTPAGTDAPTIVSSNPEAVVNAKQIPAPVAGNVTTSTTNAPAQKVAAGMNPAHGEPNHRCDIAVGAPLNSPPGKAAAPQQTVTPTPAPVAAPQPAKVENPLNLAVNPAHGEPGHSCAIPVGQAFK